MRRHTNFKSVALLFIAILCSEKRWGLPTCYKSQGGKSVFKLSLFQNGRIHLLCDLLQPNDWLGKVHLKKAYFVVPIWEKHQKFLRFVWKESLMEFPCLAFGLASTSRVFTKLMNHLLRRWGIRLIIYLDDILFINQTPSGLLWEMSTTSLLLDN